MAPTLSLVSSLIGQHPTSWPISDQLLDEILHIWGKSRHQTMTFTLSNKMEGWEGLHSHLLTSKLNRSTLSTSPSILLWFDPKFASYQPEYLDGWVWGWGWGYLQQKRWKCPTRWQKVLKDFIFCFFTWRGGLAEWHFPLYINVVWFVGKFAPARQSDCWLLGARCVGRFSCR